MSQLDAKWLRTNKDHPLYQRLANGPQLDAFGRLRTSNTASLFEYTFKNDSDFSLYWDTSLANGATTQQIDQRVVRELAVTTTTGSKAILQSKRYIEYHTGESHMFQYTANFKGAQAGVRKRHGLFDDNNGFFFETDGTTLYVVHRTNTSGSVVDTRIAQSAWNGDRLDGTGGDFNFSGHTANPENKYLFWIDYAWLSIGHIRWGVMVDGEYVILHQETFSGEQADSYSASAILPIRSEIESTGTPSAADTMELTCLNMIVEGGDLDLGKIRLADSGFSELTVNSGAGNRQPLLVLRLDPNKPYTSAKLVETAINVTSGNSTVHWEIFLNPTITGTPTWADVSNSNCEYATNASSLTISGGFKVTAGYARVNDDSGAKDTNTDIYLGRDIAGTSDIIVLSAATIASNSKVLWLQKWREFS